MVNKNREPWLAAFLSTLFPGAGQLYLGQYSRGLLYVSCQVVFFIAMINRFLLASWTFILPLLFMFSVYLLSIIDAFVTAKKNNAAGFEEARKRGKDPWLAVFLSWIMPGVGHIYSGMVAWGTAIVVLYLIIMIFALDMLLAPLGMWVHAIIQIIVTSLVYLVVMYHAYIKIPRNEQKSKSAIRSVLALSAAWFVSTILFTSLIISYVTQAFFIPAPSMNPTLIEGDHLFVEKVTYNKILSGLFFVKYQPVQRGDVVVFIPPHETEKEYVKRCIALPGEHFAMKDGAVFIDGKKLEEPYKQGSTYSHEIDIEGTVPPARIIVLGDNREDSFDSRGFGYLDLERIEGRAHLLYWNTYGQIGDNFDRLGKIR